MRVRFHNNVTLTSPWEYFCMGCGMMNLSLCDLKFCGECGDPITIKGKMYELDLVKLQADYAATKEAKKL